MVGQEAAKKTVINVLTEAGTDVRVPESAGALRDGALRDGALRDGALRDGIGTLLAQAQHAGSVRPDVQIAEVMALLISACQGALQDAWDDEPQRLALAVIFQRLRPASLPPVAFCPYFGAFVPGLAGPGYRVDGAVVLVLTGTTAHRPCSAGRSGGVWGTNGGDRG
jgi:hypothetical protein